ncbi:uncharacterized protein METZ01_LOCUS503113 [marine metagenome]|uniref:Uncharacterized protein n=1 Tax=marine metagenome TaxID=408172 RepID=A0A383E0Z4_9ZZZZ
MYFTLLFSLIFQSNYNSFEDNYIPIMIYISIKYSIYIGNYTLNSNTL